MSELTFTAPMAAAQAAKQISALQKADSYDWNHIVKTRTRNTGMTKFTVYKVVKSRQEPREVDLHVTGTITARSDSSSDVKMEVNGAPIILDVTNNEVIVLLSLLVIFFVAFVQFAGGISFLTGFTLAFLFIGYKWMVRQLAKRSLVRDIKKALQVP